MYISSFQIDGFGLFSGLEVTGLSPGLCIFLGRNEAGKSTCMEFLRSVLAGYPSPAGMRRYLAGNRLAGGSIGLGLANGQSLRVTRRPGRSQGQPLLTIVNDQNEIVGQERLEQLLSGISRDVYRTVFGFSLADLFNFDNLRTEGVRNALYGASFGTGLRSPADALKDLSRAASEIYDPKSRSGKQQLNDALRKLNALHAEMAQAREKLSGYDGLVQELENWQEKHERLARERSELEDERRRLQRGLDNWHQWHGLQTASLGLERLGDISPDFPHNGPERLARLEGDRQACEREVASLQKKVDGLRGQLDAIVVDDDLLAILPELERLAEHKAAYRQAEKLLPGQEEALARATADLERELALLGPDWDCDRIRGMDRSLFARQGLDSHAGSMNVAGAAHQAALDALAQANRDVAEAENGLEKAETALADLPTPVASLDEEQRDELRLLIARYEDSEKARPLAEKSCQQAQTAMIRAIEPLRLEGAGGSGNDLAQQTALLDQLLAGEDRALELAADLQKKVAEGENAARQVRAAEEQVELVKTRMENLRQSVQGEHGPSREDLLARAQALRKLRSLAASHEAEKERLAELDNSLQASQPPSPVKSLPLLVIGMGLIVFGFAMLVANWQFGISEYAITSTLVLPVTLWSGYLVLACGVGFLAGGLPRSGPEADRHKNDMEQLRARRDACARRLAEGGEKLAQLCQEARVEDPDPVTLDATELLLERQKELCFAEEQARKEMEKMRLELAQAQTQVSLAQSRAREHENAIQLIRRQWHEFMQSLRVALVPSPEAAASYFTRAESARLTIDARLNAESGLERLDQEAGAAIAGLASLPYVRERAGEEAGDKDLLLAARQVLDSCREAELAREQRIMANAALQNCRDELARAQGRQAEATACMEKAVTDLENARKLWSGGLAGLGLGEDLDPQTVREAFGYMDDCLACESALARARTELETSRAELAALREPLAGILRTMSAKDGESQASGRTDQEEQASGRIVWLDELDRLLGNARASRDARQERERLSASLAGEQTSLEAALAALEKARSAERALLNLAGVDNGEDFLRLADVNEKRRELLQRYQTHEDSLRAAAGQEPYERFMAGFAGMDRDAQEARVSDIGLALEQNAAASREAKNAIADLEAGIRSMTAENRLAAMSQDEADIIEQIQVEAGKWAAISLAREVLREAKARFERERQPEVMRNASAMFAGITGNWHGLSVRLDNSDLVVLPEHGEPARPEDLSRGTQEQAYLAMRLAYIRNHAEVAEALPVIMDEILVNFDSERAARTARVLAELAAGASGPAHQILYFTCHPQTVRILRDADPAASLFMVDKGRINGPVSTFD